MQTTEQFSVEFFLNYFWSIIWLSTVCIKNVWP